MAYRAKVRLTKPLNLDETAAAIQGAIEETKASAVLSRWDGSIRVDSTQTDKLRQWFESCVSSHSVEYSNGLSFELECDGPDAEKTFERLRHVFAGVVPGEFVEVDAFRRYRARALVTICAKYGLHAQPSM